MQRTDLKSTQVYHLLKAKIDNGDFPTGSKMPAVRVLARQLKVARVTIFSALKSLEKDDLIFRKDRSGIFVKKGIPADADAQKAELERKRNRSQEVADSIVEDLVHGNLEIDRYLPTRKSLQFLYKVSPTTVREALHILETMGLVQRMGSAYVAGAEKTRAPGRKNQVVVLGRPANWLSSTRILREHFLRAFEQELGKYGTPMIVQANSDGPFSKREKDRRKDSDMRGYLHYTYSVWLRRMASGGLRMLERELQQLSDLEVPTVLLNCYRIQARFPGLTFRPYPNIYPMGLNNREAGFRMGSRLALMGHRRVSVFGYSREAWNDQRIESLKRGLIRVAGKRARMVIHQASVDFRQTRERLLAAEKRVRIMLDPVARQIAKELQLESKRTVEEIMPSLHKRAVLSHLDQAMNPLFLQSFGSDSATAWVCLDPSVAASAYAFLKHRNVRIPGDLSLAAIDDNDDTLRLRITTCDLQRAGMGYLAAHCLLGDIPIKKNRQGIVEWPSRIVDRGSVGRV